jgi:hypothetical protein
MCVVCCPGSKAARPASQRSEKRSVRLFLHANSAAKPMVAFTAQSRQRKPTILTPRRQSEVRGLRRDGYMGAPARPARSLTARCQTNLDLPVRSAIFPSGGMERQRNAAVGKWPCSRLMLVSCTGRSLAVLLLVLVGRSLATILPAGRTKSRGLFAFRARTICVLTVSTVCGRRNAAKWKCSLRN